MRVFTFKLILIYLVLDSCSGQKLFSSIDKIYDKAVLAYKGDRWSECIVQFEEVLHLYKLYTKINNNCRLKCNQQQFNSNIHEIEDLKIYEKFINRRACLIDCQEQGLKQVHLKSDPARSTLKKLVERKPYEFLHMCYFHMNALPKAASAAYTYLVLDPDDESMQKNLQYYAQQPEVDVNEIVDLLSEDYMVMYKLGLEAYKKSNWRETVASMEEVITDYLSWENSCRAECESTIDSANTKEFTVDVAYSMASLIHCRQKCQHKLQELGYDSGVSFLADILNYLQISYYRLDNYKDAASTVASYLALLPIDEDMLVNKQIYSSLTDKANFVERSDIVFYYKRNKHEQDLLNFFREENNDSNSNSISI